MDYFKNTRLSRRERKREKDIYRKEYKSRKDMAYCPYCGGQMTWCSICNTWSSYCCVDYGTCMCS